MTSSAHFPPGVYEQIVTDLVSAELAGVDTDLVQRTALRPADAADRIARYVGAELERALDSLADDTRVETGITLARRLLDVMAEHAPRADLVGAEPMIPGEVLRGVGRRRPDGAVRWLSHPDIPLFDSTVLTNGSNEPRIGAQLPSEIESAEAIDLVVAFIRHSGIRSFVEAFERHCRDGKPLRILTTTYTGSTEARALDRLSDLGADVKVSYDVTTSRLHAKAWLFRRSSISTAYIGSSNLTHSALISGMEWNVRVSSAKNRDLVDKVAAVFESYWQNPDFRSYDQQEFAAAIAAARTVAGPTTIISPIAVTPKPFQDRLLELLTVAREAGHHRNLLVAATGTGKTVMAALDYLRLRQTLPRHRLLFVAHREEILDQSMATYRQVLGQSDFGEKWVGGARPQHFDHVFASVQSLRNADLTALVPDHFDVVVIDEFHHAAASSYRRLLEHLDPRELLGLTATPERADGQDIRQWFGGRIAAELRVWDAIDQGYLAPFLYYGVHDGTDLSAVPWRRGRGYDLAALTNVYTADDVWAQRVWNQVTEIVDDAASMRALGFCVTVEHARFMAARFTEYGVAAVAVSGESSDDERRGALRGLRDGRVQIIFSVDLFNEGVDVPVVDVVLMLRPTESATLFLQQLGRGLRTAPGKTACTVLDFVGMHRKEFRFDLRYRALLGGSRIDVERAIELGFPYLPSGCHMQLDRVASDIVLRSIRQAVPTQWRAKVGELRDLARDEPAVTLQDYLGATRRELSDVYAGSHTWTELREDAGLAVLPAGPAESTLRKAVGRLLHVDDHQRLSEFRRLLTREGVDVRTLPESEQRLARMLAVSVTGQALRAGEDLQAAVDLLWEHPNVRTELAELFGVLEARVDHVHGPIADAADIPLQVHAQYTRVEILAALGEGTQALTPQWREGVYDARGANADVLAFTLDKTNGEFSPTTRYRDYAINRELIHWESQSTTRADSPTGLRYQQHAARGRSILLFARLQQDDRAYWFLGPASYVSHVGARPMAITWRLTTPLPGDLYAAFAAAVA